MVVKSNAEELDLIAQEIGAEVIRGAVRYPGREGGRAAAGRDRTAFIDAHLLNVWEV